MKPGVNIFGYVHAESGVGEHTRLLVAAVREAGLDYAVIPFTKTLSRQAVEFSDFGAGRPGFDINIIGVNADQMDVFVEHFGAETLEGRYNIALWAWEIEEFPDWMAASARWVDEIWANSSFSAAAISKKVDRPVFPFPLPIRTPAPPPRCRFELSLPESFLFLFCFDFDSVFERKNPLGVVEAFKMAFPDGRGVHLLLKSINGDRHPANRARLEAAVAGCRAITFRDGYMTAEEQDCLMAACDAYVSLHRAEGFGLTMAEAMALGKPVIATGYSGNLDFMSERYAYLIPSNLVAVGPANEPYSSTAVWADPDLDTAAAAMRRVTRNLEETIAKTSHALKSIAYLHSPRVRSGFVQGRLAEVRANREGHRR